MLCNCCITLEAYFYGHFWTTLRKWKQLRTEYVQVWSVSRCLLLGEQENPQNSISLFSVFVFPTVNIFLEGDRAGSWWKPFIFLDEAGQEIGESLRAQQKGPRTMFSGGPDHPPTECDLRGPHSKMSVMDSEFLATELKVQFITLYLPPYSQKLKSFCPRGRFSIGSQISPSSPGHRWCVQWPMLDLYLPCQIIFSPQYV